MSALHVESPTVALGTNTTSASNGYSLMGGVWGHKGRVALVPQSAGIAWRSFDAKVLTSESSRRYVGGPANMGEFSALRRKARSMTEYIDAAIRHAKVEFLHDEGVFVSIPAMRGVWGNGDTLPEAIAELREGIEGWVALAQQRRIEVPVFSGITPPTQVM